MTTETMTVHKALAELKVLNDRIDKSMKEGIYCSCKKKSAKKIDGVPLDEAIKNIQGSYDKVIDLINRRKAIKKAVTNSNATTLVDICGSTYTVAEAIEMKNTGVSYEQDLMKILVLHYKTAQRNIESKNGESLENKADLYVTSLYGDSDGSNAEQAEKTRLEYIENNSYEFVDPIHILDKIEELEKRTSEFLSEVDAALSVSNAITSIEISY